MKPYILLLLTGCILTACKKSDNGSGDTITPPVSLAITDFTPKSGQANTKITITGTGFGNDKSQVKVAIGDSPFDYPTSVTPTTIEVQTNLATPSGTIKVIVNGNRVISASSFTAVPPTLTSISFDGDNRLGHVLNIRGDYFGSDTSKVMISFGGTTPVKPTYISSSQSTVQTTIPRYAKEGKITVTFNGVTVASDSVLRFNTSIADFTPKSFHVGDIVTITGFGFTTLSDMAVGFNDGKITRPLTVSPTSMTVMVPATAMSGYLGISSNLGTVGDLSPTKYTVIK